MYKKNVYKRIRTTDVPERFHNYIYTTLNGYLSKYNPLPHTLGKFRADKTSEGLVICYTKHSSLKLFQKI